VTVSFVVELNIWLQHAEQYMGFIITNGRSFEGYRLIVVREIIRCFALDNPKPCVSFLAMDLCKIQPKPKM